MERIEDSFRNILIRILTDLAGRANGFVMSPDRDFSRKRKLPFAETMLTIIKMEGNSLSKEMCDIHNFDPSRPFITKSAFVQQCGKIKHEAFEEVFRAFNAETEANDLNLYAGYRLLAIDGSDVNIALNPGSETYFGPECNRSEKGFNQFHVNAMFDILNNTYSDCVIQPAPKEHEIEAARIMVRRLGKDSCPDLIICDRGYGSLDLMETIRDSNADFLIRVSNTGFIKEISELPMEELDIDMGLTIVTRQTNETKALRAQGKVKYLPGPSRFNKEKRNVSWHHPSPYRMGFRVVRFQLDTGEFETIVTSLDRKKFPISRIRELYHLRWGVETSFRTLKYAIGLTSFHARKEESVKQEIFARLLMYNFCARIAGSVVIEQHEDNVYTYKVNFTQAIHICFAYLKRNLDIDIRELIRRHVEAVRPGRTDKRKIKPKGVVYFIYRVA